MTYHIPGAAKRHPGSRGKRVFFADRDAFALGPGSRCARPGMWLVPRAACSRGCAACPGPDDRHWTAHLAVRIHSRLGFAHQEMRGPLPSGSATISRTNLSTDGDAAAAGLIPLDLAEFVRIKKSPILTTYLSYSCKIMCAEKTTSVPAAEVEKRFDYYRDRAANEPILILKNGRPETVLLSYDEFVRLKGRQAYSIDDLPAHLVTAILEAKIPDELEGAWKRGADRGRDEGEKDRPVALLLAKAPGEGECIVLPITHSPPNDPADAVEIPEIERRRLGLDQERSWILLTEFNAFFWPGADLRPIPNEDPSTVIYGMLSRQLFARVLERVKARLRARLVGRVSRI